MNSQSGISVNRASTFRQARTKLFRVTMFVLSFVLPAIMLSLVAFLAIYSWPAMQHNGVGFLASNDWDLGNEYGTPITVNGQEILPGASYGILFLIVGTLASSAIALLLALPLGLAAAIFISEIIPPRVRDPIASVVELLASVPSVVFGLWGYVVVIPFMAHYVYPGMADVLGFIPFFGKPVGSGYGLLTAGIVLALMAVPIITANVREALTSTPQEVVESGRVLGATRFEVVRSIMLPRIRQAIIGVSILGLGRAIGETMAVLMVSGNALNMPDNIYGTVSTMAAFIVSQLDSALEDPTGMAISSLTEIGLILLIIAVLVNGVARLLLLRFAK